MISFISRMSDIHRPFVWWLFFSICLIYSVYALDLARLQLYMLLGIDTANEVKARATPLAFLVHSTFGSLGLLCGIVQLNPRILHRCRRFHRITGWTYLLSIWLTSSTGFWMAPFFDVPVSAKAVFMLIAAVWFVSTTIAWLKIRAHRIQQHRNWMIRSFSVTFFFVTFSVWVPVLLDLLPAEIAWPLGVLLAAVINMLVAELCIRRLHGNAFGLESNHTLDQLTLTGRRLPHSDDGNLTATSSGLLSE